MTDKLFDSFIKSKLEHYDSGAPMHVWERIKNEKDRRPKGFFFWRNRYFFILSVLILSGSATFVLLNFNTPSLSIETATVTAASENKSSTASFNQQTTAPAIKQTETEPKNHEFKTDGETEVSSEKEPSASSITFNNQEITGTQETNIGALHKKETKGVRAPKSQKYRSVNSSVSTIVDRVPKNVMLQEQILSIAENQNHSSIIPEFRQGVIGMPQNKPTCPTINGPRRRDFYLEVYVSPDYNVRSLQTANTPGNYLADRNAVENYRTSYSGGVRLVKNLGEKTLLKAGVNYTQINERLRMVSENSKQLTQIITIRTVVRSPGDTLFVRDTMYYEQSGTRYRTTYNRFRFLDIPVIFSYEFGDPELMHFAVNAGPVFNIISFYNGEVMDTTYRPLAISTKAGTNANNWRSNIGMGMFASVSIFKKLNSRIHLFGEPYVRYNFNPVTQHNNFIKQRYFITGMQLGVRYNFIPSGQRYKR